MASKDKQLFELYGRGCALMVFTAIMAHLNKGIFGVFHTETHQLTLMGMGWVGFGIYLYGVYGKRGRSGNKRSS